VPLAPRISSRSYGVSVEPPVEYPKYKGKTRYFGERKTHLYHQYLKILESTSEKPTIFLHHNDFTFQRLTKLRWDITAASSRTAPSLAIPSPAPVLDRPILTIVRSAVFGAVLRDFAPLDIEAGREISKLVPKGGLAILTLPSFNPPQLDAILRIMDRTVPPRKPLTQEELEAKEAEKNADPVTPGRAPQRVRRAPQPELKLLGALIERRVFSASGVKSVSKLPTLDTLRAQVVGLLSSPATQLAAVLSEASGGKLARTLEGLKEGLKEGQDAQP
jgi:ribosomal protein L10